MVYLEFYSFEYEVNGNVLQTCTFGSKLARIIFITEETQYGDCIGSRTRENRKVTSLSELCLKSALHSPDQVGLGYLQREKMRHIHSSEK